MRFHFLWITCLSSILANVSLFLNTQITVESNETATCHLFSKLHYRPKANVLHLSIGLYIQMNCPKRRNERKDSSTLVDSIHTRRNDLSTFSITRSKGNRMIFGGFEWSLLFSWTLWYYWTIHEVIIQPTHCLYRNTQSVSIHVSFKKPTRYSSQNGLISTTFFEYEMKREPRFSTNKLILTIIMLFM